jgi:hypothetical protein
VPFFYSLKVIFIIYASPIVNVPETVNVAILSPPGCVEVEFVPGLTVNAMTLGALTTTTPDPPEPAGP